MLSAPGTLSGIDPLLERAGVRVIRVPTIAPTPVPWERWRPRVDREVAVEVVVVTSRTGVAAGVVPWLSHAAPATRRMEFWAVGPATARALRAAGIRRAVHRPTTVGTLALARALARGPPRKIVYFRSDRAGPGLARSLRRRGHCVVDLVVYRVGSAPELTARVRRELAEADLWAATSPSALGSLRTALGARRFSARARRRGLVVLGERTRRAAAAYGFRRVSVAPATTQRFTRHVLERLRDARP